MNQYNFAQKVARTLSKEYDCDYRIVQNNHIKVTFELGGKSVIWVLSTTPSERNSRKNAIKDVETKVREILSNKNNGKKGGNDM